MKKEGRRAFWLSLGISLFLLMAAAGFVAVDYQGRRLSFGDSDLPLQTMDMPEGRTELKIKLFGVEKEVDITEIDKFWKLFLDFSCIPHS